MHRRRVSVNKNKTIKTGVAFCSETGKRLDNVRYDTRELIRNSACKNSWAQDVVKALFNSEFGIDENLKSSAESVLSNLHSRAKENTFFGEKNNDLPKNFSRLEKRSKHVKVRKVKKQKEDSELDGKLLSVIEGIVEEKLAQV